MSLLPKLQSFNYEFDEQVKKRLFIVSEGFEARSTYWINSTNERIRFFDAIIFKYEPEKKSRLHELLPIVQRSTINQPQILIFDRFNPYEYERDFTEKIGNYFSYDEIVIDISVMSKLMILIIMNSMKHFENKITIIYTEPEDYSPSEDEYNKAKHSYSDSLGLLPSQGVHGVIRTPLLSSVVMQRSPTLVVAFLSFNEQLIRSLLSVLNPTDLFLINGIPSRLLWRYKATQEIHNQIIKEFQKNNPVDANGEVIRKTSSLNYIETFELLAEIYKTHCYSRRIILSPTGSKMQSLATALIKLCCPDIHIEYPTPESYYTMNYSSSEILAVHSVEFTSFKNFMNNLAESYGLNG